MGFLAQTKIKAYTKLTALMCYQNVDRRSIAPSSGHFLDKIKNFEEKNFKFIRPLWRSWPNVRSGLSKEFLISSDVNCLVGFEGGGGPPPKT